MGLSLVPACRFELLVLRLSLALRVGLSLVLRLSRALRVGLGLVLRLSRVRRGAG